MADTYIIENVEALWPKLDQTYAFDKKANRSMPCGPRDANAEFSIAFRMDNATAKGLFFRSTKTKYWTSDWEQMYSFIKEHDVPEFLDKRLNQTNVKQFLEENPDVLPKGMNVDTEYVISVRKK